MTSNYTPGEERGIAAALGRGDLPACPRCGAAMDRRDVPPNRQVSYVRRRLWLVCRGCRRSVVVDRPDSGQDPSA